MKNNTELKIEIIESTEDNYLQYPGQCTPQPAFIEIDTECRTMEAGIDYEIGSAVPMRVWNNINLRFSIDECLTVSAINELLEIIAPLAAELCDHVEIVWDGSNHVGKFDERAEELAEEIETIAREYDGAKFEVYSWGYWICGEEINVLDNYGSFEEMIEAITPDPDETILTGDPEAEFSGMLDNLSCDDLSKLPQWVQKRLMMIKAGESK